MPTSPQTYIGRFAPSPSGPLHLGSLACALASYFDAKANRGRWLIRIEDIDPPREQAGADKIILETLEAHGLLADEPPRYQSQRSQAYVEALQRLSSRKLVYRCDCSRKRIQRLGGSYDGHCRGHTPSEDKLCALRVNALAATEHSHHSIEFYDRFQGKLKEDFEQSGDFIVRRRDGLFAYQLAVSVDDLDQQITHIVRGSDLLETTPKQILLINLLGGTVPEYAHIPVLVSTKGMKLSKQNHAPAVDNLCPADNIKTACRALGLGEPPPTKNMQQLLSWGTGAWQKASIYGQREVLITGL